jgi:hypothetical protein
VQLVNGGGLVRPVVALWMGLALMVVAWSAVTPLGQGPDEPAHYVKALAAGRGHAHGAEPKLANVDTLIRVIKSRRSTDDHAAQVRALRFVDDASGAFALPNRLVPQVTCFPNVLHRADPRRPADCSTTYSDVGGSVGAYTSYVAAYPPYVYVPPGLVSRAAGDDHGEAAYWLARAVFALAALALVGLALLMLWEDDVGVLSLAGPLVALTPMSLWSFAVFNSSGLEIAAALCWIAGLLRLLRRPPSPGWVWAATAAGGVVLATARPSGPLFVLLAPLCIALVFGWPRLREAARDGARDAVLAAIAVVTGVAAALYWQRYMPGYSLGAGTLGDSVGPAIEGLPRALRESVGRFAGDYFVPVYLAAAWGLLLAALVGAAAFLDRERRTRLLLLVLACAVYAVAYATAYLTSGFDEFYGRYLLPGLAVLPLCAGAILAERVDPVQRHRLALALIVPTAVLQLLTWWLEARRLAVGSDGPFFFLGDAGWTPPGGWLVWVAVFLAGAVATASAPVSRRLAALSR